MAYMAYMYFYSVHALVENDFISSRRPIWPARCTCVSMCMCICICMFVCVPHVRVHVCVCLCMRMCNSMCVCMHICVTGNEIALIFQCLLEVGLICMCVCLKEKKRDWSDVCWLSMTGARLHVYMLLNGTY